MRSLFYSRVARQLATLCGVFSLFIVLTSTFASASVMEDGDRVSPAVRVAFWNIPDNVVMGIAAANRTGGIDGAFISSDLTAYDAYVLFAPPGLPLARMPYGDVLGLDGRGLLHSVSRIMRAGLPPVLIFDPALLEDGYDAACVGRLIHRTVVRGAEAGRMPIPQLAGCDNAVRGTLVR